MFKDIDFDKLCMPLDDWIKSLPNDDRIIVSKSGGMTMLGSKKLKKYYYLDQGDTMKDKPEFDIVQKASHYNQGKYEVIDVLEDWGLDKNANLFNVVKYVARAEHKGKKLQDLEKAQYYLTREINKTKAEQSPQIAMLNVEDELTKCQEYYEETYKNKQPTERDLINSDNPEQLKRDFVNKNINKTLIE